MKFTIFVDSSLCPTTKAGGFGVWCKKDGWERGSTFGGKLERPAKDSTDAELLGIAQAFDYINKYEEFNHVTYLMLQCDSLYALHALIKFGKFQAAAKIHASDSDVARKAHEASPAHKELVRRIVSVVDRVPIKTVRHIKGHREGISSRSWVNERCDAIAKEHMRAARSEAYARASVASKRVHQSNSDSGMEF